MKQTDISDPAYFHKVVDCQWACPAHTPVPEYIRLIAAGRFDDAYMINWKSNVFPGILGRTCDRPCEPACRRGRVEEGAPAGSPAAKNPEPVAICRLKRVAADHKADIRHRLPRRAARKNGKRIALIGAGPASLTVARDLVPLGYECVIYDGDTQAGGMIRSQIPKFRLPESVIDEEVGYILDLGVEFHGGTRIDSLKGLLQGNGSTYDAIFVGSGAPRGRDLDLPGRKEAAKHINIGIDWLASVSFGHVDKIGKRVIVLGGGNTAMDCCRSSRRLGGEDVKVIVRSGFDEMKASPWEKEDSMHEGIPIINYHVPKAFIHEFGKLTGMLFEKVVDKHGLPILDKTTFQSTHPKVFFGGDSAFGPKNIIWAVAHGHEAAISIDAFCRDEDLRKRPSPLVNLLSQKMGIHEWSYDNDVTNDARFRVPLKDKVIALKNIKMEVELGFDAAQAYAEAQRCLNCDVQTVFTPKLCIECDACVDICPMDCITFAADGEEQDLRGRLNAPSRNPTQDLYVASGLKTGRVMAKDEDVRLHCGLCAERCPTGAWDMQKFFFEPAQAHDCQRRRPAVASTGRGAVYGQAAE